MRPAPTRCQSSWSTPSSTRTCAAPGSWRREVARRLIAEERPGRIVNISSVGGFHYQGGGAALYSVTKAAIARITEVLAVEWARNHINVNAIAPGSFESEMMAGMIERVGDFTSMFPRKRIGRPGRSSTARCCTSCRPRPRR